METDLAPPWHVLYVKYRQEKKVAQLLIEKNIEVFLPLVRTVRTWSDRKKKIYSPLFSRYVFVRMHSKVGMHEALKPEGSLHFVKCGGKIATVRNSEIIQLKQLLNLDGISDIKAEGNLPCIGQKMKICYGPLNGMDCEVIKANNRSKIIVRVESIQHNITAFLPDLYLSPHPLISANPAHA